MLLLQLLKSVNELIWTCISICEASLKFHELQVGVANIIWQQTFGRTLAYDDPLLEHVKDLAKEVNLFYVSILCFCLGLSACRNYLFFIQTQL